MQPTEIKTDSLTNSIEKQNDGKAQMPENFNFLSTPEDEEKHLNNILNNDLILGLKTGYPELDKHFRFKNGNLVVINGLDNVGKSTLLWYLAVITNVMHGWKWILYTSENNDATVRSSLIKFKYGKSIDKLSKAQYKVGLEWAYANFPIIKSDELNSVESLILKATKTFEKGKHHGFLIDPYNSLDVSLSGENQGLSTHDYHYKALTKLRIFCDKQDCATFVNTHAITSATRAKDAEGYTMAPGKADTEGGSKFSSRADDMITAHRITNHPIVSNQVQIHIRKIKEVETGGKPTQMDKPVILSLSIVNGWYGFFDDNGNCPLRDAYERSLEQNQQ